MAFGRMSKVSLACLRHSWALGAAKTCGAVYDGCYSSKIFTYKEDLLAL